MRKDSFLIRVNTVLVSAAVVAGIWYVANFQPATSVSTKEAMGTVLPPHPQPEEEVPPPNGHVSAETPSGRTYQIIECHSPDIGRFWTNAASCDEAVLHNRVSVADG